MKFNCGKTRDQLYREYALQLRQWHDYFAWWPIRVGPEECVWLEVVERRNTSWSSFSPEWEYRTK